MRLSLRWTALAFACASALVWAAPSGSPAVTGTVFRDFDADGVQDPTEPGVGAVAVQLFDAGGSCSAVANSNSSGAYSVDSSACSGTDWRLEFSAIPNGLEPGVRSGATAAGTAVAFVNAGDVANLALNNPNQFCGPSPQIVTSVFIGGQPSGNPLPTIRTFDYGVGSTNLANNDGVSYQDYTVIHNATFDETGPTRSYAHHRRTNSVLAGNYARRHSGYRLGGPGTPDDSGPDGIWLVPLEGAAAPSLFFSAEAGSDGHDYTALLNDVGFWDYVGKSGWGNLELSEDQTKLYAANLFDRLIYVVDVNVAGNSISAGAHSTIDIGTQARSACGLTDDGAGDPSGDDNDYVVGFAKEHDGELYIGVTCTAESSQLTTDLEGFVFADLGAGYVPVASIPLDYPREWTTRGYDGAVVGVETPAEWLPWTPVQPAGDPPHPVGEPVVYDQAYYPQPWLSDMEIAEDGRMVIGISDRGGDQFGNDQGASTWGNFEGVAAGDALVLAPAGANAWTFTPGPTGDEFFNSESYPLAPNFPGQPLHSEITLGHVAHIPGTNEFLFNVMDPAPAFGAVRNPAGTVTHYTESWLSGGLVWMSGSDGSRVRHFMTFGVNEVGTFGKASSVGDVEIICDPAPLQIGNRVFIDRNGNSIQDTGDTAVAGVTLTVYSAAGVQLGRTTTDAFGNWTINFSRGATDPSANDSEVVAPDPFAQNVFVVVDASNFSGPGALVGYRAVTANADASTGGDGRDSDGVSQAVPSVGTVIAAAYAVGLPGQNDHNIDFGFSNLDFGDLPDVYGTLTASNGPRHTIVSGLQLGAVIDAELDGQPQASALGDDLDVVPDDEEAVSVFVIGNLVAGIANTVPVTVLNTTPTSAQLCGFLDANADGDFADAGESVSAAVPSGTNGAINLSFTPPITAGGFVFARFRLSTDATPCSPVGVANDGEVEDYQALIRRADFGDLPDTGAGVGAGNYNTLYADNGAWHEITNTRTTLFLGASVDVDADAVPSAAANGDDLAGSDDEDGLNPADLNQIAGSNAVLRFQATNLLGSTGNLCGYIDWNGDGDFADANESATTTVPGGSNNVTATLNFGATPLSAVGTRYGRFRYTTAACVGGSGFGSNGEVEDYVITVGDRRDFGDAPVSYATVLANDGARHIILPSGNPQLGATIDAELDGQPNAGANGDDGNGDDEDGVTFPALTAGQSAQIAVSTPTGGSLSCWIDYNADGDFADAGENAISGQPLTAGSANLSINVPVGATSGNTYARCRISSGVVASPSGEAPDGEVEDYLIAIGAQQHDFGDAPASYATLLANNGARHIILPSNNPQLGATIDAEADGQPTGGANGDDSNGDDEDGVIIPTLNPGLTASVAISSGATGGVVSCWIDYNVDGDFADAGELAVNGLNIAGSATLNPVITVPATAVEGNSYARCRISSSAVASFDGEAANGEVEDYPVSLRQRRDFGDAPASYGTVIATGNAAHIILASNNPQLGATIDAEADGQPTAGANGDDSNGDDEDGVSFPTLTAGETAQIGLSTGPTGGSVSCWIDYNIDGDFADAGELAVNNQVLAGMAITTAGINVPASATTGSTYARCRISSSAVASPVGEVANGEVEDYLVSIGDPLLSLGNLVWEDRNNNGLVDAGEPGINGVPVRLFADANDDNIADGAALQTTSTNASGIYGFVGLAAGTYLVEITAPANFIGSTGSGLPYVTTGSSEPAVDPDNDADNDDNGTGLSGVIRSRSITLVANDEPTNDGDTDANSNLSVDFGLLRNFDLALRKQLASGQPSTVAPGDTVEFVITVFNQGTEAASNIQVHDTLPDGLTLADASWTSVPTNAAQRVITGPLAAGASTAISLFATVDSDATGELINTAEIALANDSSGQPGNDIDSDPDTDPNNDGPVVDDAIDNSGGDEDDADSASVTVQIAPPPPPPTPLTIPSNNGYALLALLLLIGWSTWRRRD